MTTFVPDGTTTPALIEITTADGSMPVRTAGDPAADAAIIVLHQASGPTPHIDAVIADLSDLGYYAVAPDLFYRRKNEPVPFPSDPSMLPAFDAWLPGDSDLLTDLSAVTDHLGDNGFDLGHVGVMGYSFGGRATYLAAATWPFAAAVTYYAGGIGRHLHVGNPDLAALRGKTLRTPWLGLFGEADHFIGEGELDLLETLVGNAPVATSLVRYPGVQHSFDVDVPEAPGAFDADAAANARSRAIEFLNLHLRRDDRQELIAVLSQQDWVDDPIAGFATPDTVRSSSPVWPDSRWATVELTMHVRNDRREVREYLLRRADPAPVEVPIAVVVDRDGSDRRARIYFDKSLFGSDQPRRPILAPGTDDLPPDLAEYHRALVSGDRESLEKIIASDARIQSPYGVIDRGRFVDEFATAPGGPERGAPVEYCTVTAESGTYACEFIGWRRPPHCGVAVYRFVDGRLQAMRVYEGPVYR
ncbi:dienelactone hydrolase family protein [Rhodococcus sp. NPDC076796]|uniref:dienelactone hydrolase family protein n=1 Tax=Rhodococcus sp. NPDC076796 TaxID=3154859 RepID=UPI00344CD3C8